MATSALERSVFPHFDECAGQSFLSHLRNLFTDDEASTFLDSFAMFLHEKNDEYCIDLDNSWRWLGHSKKQSSVELVHKILHKNLDFLFTATSGRNKPDKYMLKADSFKKLLLAARTETSKKAADYFIKIEKAVQQFYANGGQTFAPEPRNCKWKTLALDRYREELSNPPEISSAGYNDDLSDPQFYLAIPKNVKFPPGFIPEGTAVVEFGWTSSSGKRFEAHRKSHGEFIAMDHFPCPDAPGLEHELKKQLTVLDLLVYGKRQDGSKNTELFKVRSQAEYLSIVARIYEIQQRIISSVCDVQRQKEKRLTAEAEKVSNKHKLAQEKEKTLQEKEKTRQSDNDSRLELSLHLGQTPCRPAEQDNIVHTECDDQPDQATAAGSGHAETDTDDENAPVSISQVGNDNTTSGELQFNAPAASLIPPSDYGNEGRMAVKMIRARLVESYLIEQLDARCLPAKIPLQAIVQRFNDWLIPPSPAPRKYHCRFSVRMFLNPMKAYEKFGIIKKKIQRTKQYLIDHDTLQAHFVADEKMTLPRHSGPSPLSDQAEQMNGKARSYINELAARKDRTRKEQEKRAKLVDEWLLYQLGVQELPIRISNSKMLQLFNNWLDCDNVDPKLRKYPKPFTRKLLPLPLLAYEQHGFARKISHKGLKFYVDYNKLRSHMIK